jgi:tRNA G18 (ribose-2'-O)-methylase SpoU
VISDQRLVIDDYSHITDHGWLLERKLFVAEGRLVVRRLIEAGTFPIKSILLTPAARTALADLLDSRELTVHVCDQKTLNGIAGFNFHRGCLALAERPATNTSVNQFAGARRLLALEGVSNPDNVGGLFRVAAAFGVAGVLLDRASGDPLYRKAIRTSMGASLQVPFARLDPWQPMLRSLRGTGSCIVALTPDGSALPLARYAAEFPPERRLILMVGAEGPGLSAASLESADTRVRIPIAPHVDSLNVVVAAGIALAQLNPPR